MPAFLLSLLPVVVASASTAPGAGAGTSTTVTQPTDFKPIVDALAAQISVESVIAVLAYVVAACIALVFMWWGVRKVTKMIMSAFKKGKLSV